MSKEMIFPQELQPLAVESTFTEVAVLPYNVEEPVVHEGLGPVGGTIALVIGVATLAALVAVQDKGNIHPWSKPSKKERAISPDDDSADFYKKLSASDEN